MVLLKYLSNFLTTLKLPLTNCEVSLMLGWYISCVLSSNALKAQATKHAITYTKLYVPPVTFSTQSSVKLFMQLKSGFKRMINWNKY